MRTWRIGWFLIAVSFIVGVVFSSTVEVDGEVVSGSATEDGIHFYLGVPYAAAPVGELRWRPPLPVARWEGVREATRYGDSCVQTLPPEAGFAKIYGTTSAPGRSEDCLFVNVWTPTGAPRLGCR